MTAAMMNTVAQGDKLRLIQNFFRMSMHDIDEVVPGKIRERCGGVWGCVGCVGCGLWAEVGEGVGKVRIGECGVWRAVCGVWRED